MRSTGFTCKIADVKKRWPFFSAGPGNVFTAGRCIFGWSKQMVTLSESWRTGFLHSRKNGDLLQELSLRNGPSLIQQKNKSSWCREDYLHKEQAEKFSGNLSGTQWGCVTLEATLDGSCGRSGKIHLLFLKKDPEQKYWNQKKEEAESGWAGLVTRCTFL